LEESALVDRIAMRRRLEMFLRYWLPVIAYLGLVQFMGSRPTFQVPMLFPNADKAVHVIEYLILGVLLIRAVRQSFGVPVPLRSALITLAIGVCVGVSDEFLQQFVPNRQSSVNDLLADTTGLLFSQVLYLFAVRE
jgi:VanZ family protein